MVTFAGCFVGSLFDRDEGTLPADAALSRRMSLSPDAALLPLLPRFALAIIFLPLRDHFGQGANAPAL